MNNKPSIKNRMTTLSCDLVGTIKLHFYCTKEATLTQTISDMYTLVCCITWWRCCGILLCSPIPLLSTARRRRLLWVRRLVGTDCVCRWTLQWTVWLDCRRCTRWSKNWQSLIRYTRWHCQTGSWWLRRNFRVKIRFTRLVFKGRVGKLCSNWLRLRVF